MTTTGKKKRGSMKNKRAWRKHSNIADVENFLDELRAEERLGKKITTKTDDELFKVDTIKAPPPEVRKRTFRTRKEKREQFEAKIPRSELSLVNTSYINDPIVKRNRVRTPEERKPNICREKKVALHSAGKLTKREQRVLTDRIRSYRTVDRQNVERKHLGKFEKNLWQVEPLDPRFDQRWMKAETMKHTLDNTGHKVVKVPSVTYFKPSKLQAIENPHPGVSYNPSLGCHQDLIKTVIDREEDIMKKERHLNRVTTAMFRPVTQENNATQTLQELLSGLPNGEKNDDSADEDTALANEYQATNPAVENKKKSKQTRRKQREQRELQQNLLERKIEKKKVTDINRIKKVAAEIVAETEALAVSQEVRSKQKKAKDFTPRQLGPMPYAEPEIDLSKASELSGNLRNVTVTGSILRDRFKSLQKRSMLAPAKDVGLRKLAKIKRFVRNSHKGDIVLDGKVRKRRKH